MLMVKGATLVDVDVDVVGCILAAGIVVQIGYVLIHISIIVL